MKIEIEALKTLVEAGDKSAIEKHIFVSLEKGDILTAATTNTVVKSDLDSAKDTYHATALETWKKNKLPGLIDEAVKAANPDETPEQKQIRELQERLDAKDKEAQTSALKAKALEHVAGKLPVEFASKYIDKFLGDDEASTTASLDELKKDLDVIVQAQVEEKLKGSARGGAGGGYGGAGKDELSLGKRLAQENTNKTAEEQQAQFFK